MDGEIRRANPDSIVVTGFGTCRTSPGNERALSSQAELLLKNRKTLKFMGKQDQLAVVAFGAAIKEGELSPQTLRSTVGLYLVVGYIPFERDEMENLADASTLEGRFSLHEFSTKALHTVSPLLTFRCLPNMPAFHISANFGVTGRSFVTYPGAGQLYQALDQALNDLRTGIVEIAILGGVADQNNFLVANHLRRVPRHIKREFLDSAAFVSLELRAAAERRGAKSMAEYQSHSISYLPPNPMQAPALFREEIFSNGEPRNMELIPDGGCASLPLYLADSYKSGALGEVRHSVSGSDGISATSLWRAC